MARRIFLADAAALALAAGARAYQAEALDWLGRANTLYQQKQYEQALAAYARCLQKDNHIAAGYQGVGSCYLALNDRGKAAKYLRYALQLDPRNTAVQSLLAGLSQASLAAGQADDFLVGNQLYQQRRYDEAAAAYTRATQADPRHARAFQGLGNAHYAKADYPQAMAAYRRALELDPSNTSLSAFLASTQGLVAGQSASAAADAGPKDWLQPAWRSVILPGWGQAYNGQAGKGLVLGGLTLGLFAGELASYMVGNRAREDYLAATGPAADYDGMYGTWDSMAQVNHVCYIGMTAVYAYTVIDAVLNARSRKKTTGALPAPPPVEVAFDRDGMSVRARLLSF